LSFPRLSLQVFNSAFSCCPVDVDGNSIQRLVFTVHNFQALPLCNLAFGLR
jgi:hypothetical protein